MTPSNALHRTLTQSQLDRIAVLIGEGKTPAEIARLMPNIPWEQIDNAVTVLRVIMTGRAS